MAASKRKEKVTKPVAPLRVKVKFLKNCDPGNGKPVFKAGTIRELVISSANHWVRRGMAEKYVERPERAKSAKPKQTKSVGRRRKITAKTKPVTVKTEPAEPVVVEFDGTESATKETVTEKTPGDEAITEGKKTEDGESFGGMDDLMA